MNRSEQLKRHLCPGRVYRRADLAQWSKSVDRHARELVAAGVLQKLQNGLYYYPKASVFGRVPAEERELVRRFLKEDDFLLTSPNAYNTLGLGTTQLYNTHVVYNHKRHGRFTLGGHAFEFRRKPRFPRKLTEEFLLVDLLNNLPALAEDVETLRARARAKAKELNAGKLRLAARDYGKVATRKFFDQALADAA
ncbi:hypothetical protein SCL_0997 [Sulfuricaulis limicola]|uniref:Transcriptional regulator, AbiEi antitoxin, Type IV TA system n=1 Tax=Sulfuricaulis limicola TaxID=1620215 RepID=A0A1B4XET7_9GAMM|nr:hypothetical protein [Sulfuricaulis limicola]BAV33313.1 hypothetical protein SCL_0997 [Sulfuricaulis limicola]